MNFDEFGNYSSRRQQSKLKSIRSQIEKREMPLKSYKLLHKKASLTELERSTIINWVIEKVDQIQITK